MKQISFTTTMFLMLSTFFSPIVQSAAAAKENVLNEKNIFLMNETNIPEFKSNFIESIGILFILFGIMTVTLFILKRIKSKGRHSSGALRITSNCYIGNNKRISILEVDGRRYLIGITSTQITLLSELPEAKIKGNFESENLGKKEQNFKKYFDSLTSSSGKEIIRGITKAFKKERINLKYSD
ncbi:MAG: hypothetical protein D6734_07955 [Candidatus Schekmanbacteria bacterium]|nr:MAG: hypothetical protein D6734_07955 [Candidatus Schekmanbacteria bacterium]